MGNTSDGNHLGNSQRKSEIERVRMSAERIMGIIEKEIHGTRKENPNGGNVQYMGILQEM